MISAKQKHSDDELKTKPNRYYSSLEIYLSKATVADDRKIDQKSLKRKAEITLGNKMSSLLVVCRYKTTV